MKAGDLVTHAPMDRFEPTVRQLYADWGRTHMSEFQVGIIIEISSNGSRAKIMRPLFDSADIDWYPLYELKLIEPML